MDNHKSGILRTLFQSTISLFMGLFNISFASLIFIMLAVNFRYLLFSGKVGRTGNVQVLKTSIGGAALLLSGIGWLGLLFILIKSYSRSASTHSILVRFLLINGVEFLSVAILVLISRFTLSLPLRDLFSLAIFPINISLSDLTIIAASLVLGGSNILAFFSLK